MKKTITAVILVLIALYILTFSVEYHLSGAFKVPIHLKGDRAVKEIEYMTVYDYRNVESDRSWRSLEKNTNNEYVARLPYVLIKVDWLLWADEENYTCGDRVMIRVRFEDGGALLLSVPVDRPYDGRAIEIDTSVPNN